MDPRDVADLVAGLVVLVGLVGIVVPVLPGTLLLVVALLGWAAYVGEPRGWALAVAGLVVLAAGAALKYVLAGRHLRGHGVPVTDARREQVLELVQGDLDEAVVRTLTWLGVAPDAVRAVVLQQVRDLLHETAR